VKGEVLDFGSGYGDITFAISKTHPVLGVDVDPERVTFAGKEYAAIQFAVCRPTGLDFPDASFDVITSVVVIGFVSEPENHLREAHRLLRSGGHLLLVFQCPSVVRNLFRRWTGRGTAEPAMWTPSAEEPRRLWMFSPKEVRNLLRRTGFLPVAEDFFYEPPGTLETGRTCSSAGRN